MARRKNLDGAVAVFREMKQASPDLVTQCRVVAVIGPLIWRRADVNWLLEIWHTFVSVGCSVKGHTRRSLGELLVGRVRSSEERPTFDNRLGAIQGQGFCCHRFTQGQHSSERMAMHAVWTVPGFSGVSSLKSAK